MLLRLVIVSLILVVLALGYRRHVVFSWYGHHRYLHVLTHSVPTRRSSDLRAWRSTATRSSRSSWTSETHSWVWGTSRARCCSRTAATCTTTFQQTDRKSTRLNSSH